MPIPTLHTLAQAFFVRLQKTQGQPQKIARPILGKKTQPVGGGFKFQQKNSRNCLGKMLFFFGITLLKVIYF